MSKKQLGNGSGTDGNLNSRVGKQKKVAEKGDDLEGRVEYTRCSEGCLTLECTLTGTFEQPL